MNFYKRPGGESKTGRGRPGKGLAGEAVFCRSFQSDFTNEMGEIMEPDEPEATASMPMLPKIALRGNFLLVIDHFISEITDCTQRQKTASPASPFPGRPRPVLLSPPGRL